jgi:hypothetical protein
MQLFSRIGAMSALKAFSRSASVAAKAEEAARRVRRARVRMGVLR